LLLGHHSLVPQSVASANLGTAFLELGQMCKAIPLDAPWNAKKAAKWDRV